MSSAPARLDATDAPSLSRVEIDLDEARAALNRTLVEPSPQSLWELQKTLLVIRGEPATRARAVARAFHACLRGLESKSASRSASRMGAVLSTAAVGSVSLRDVLDRQDGALGNLLQSSVPAMLEIGAAMKSAQAWEVESRLIYDEFAWFLYEELWAVSVVARPQLSASERRGQIDSIIDTLLDTQVSDDDRAALVVNVFQAVLAARVVEVFAAGSA